MITDSVAWLTTYIEFFQVKRCSTTLSLSISTGEVTLKDLTNELTEVVDWFHMGGNLEVPPHELKKIKYDCKNADDCMIQMLMVRMQLKKMTWSDIIRALVGIKMRSLAHKIAVKYGMFVCMYNVANKTKYSLHLAGVALPLPSIGPSVPLATEVYSYHYSFPNEWKFYVHE